MSSKIAVGVDAGGTGTLAIASRGGVELGKGCAGPANASSRGIEAAADAIACAVGDALAGVAETFTLFVGAAGAGREAAALGLAERLRTHLPRAREVRVEEDTLIALRCAIAQGPGIVLIAGTGSAAYAENEGKRARVGGAGYLLGDEGSGFAIGMAALRALARVLDGRARSDEMTQAVAAALAIVDRDDLLSLIYGAPATDVGRIAGLATQVLALANKGDRSAVKIVQAAARDLGDLACAAAKQVELTEASPCVALHGGLLKENSLLTYLLQTRLQADLPGAAILRAQGEPARAALRFAQALGESA